MPGVFRIGVAGWSYEDWKGIVYPAAPGRGFDPLALLSSWFDLVELNVTFYRTVAAATARSWARRVAGRPGFRFTAKVHRDLTHGASREPELVAEVQAGLDPLRRAGLLGALLFQFPWSFERTRETEASLAALLDLFERWPRVVEVRHASWDEGAFRDLLRARGVGLCAVDMPVTRRSLGLRAVRTSPLAYLRLHGRNYATWFDPGAGRDDRYDYLYGEAELGEVAAAARGMAEGAEETFIVANNHFRGQAVATALALKGILKAERTSVPERLLRAFPALGSTCDAERRPRQGGLFR